MTEEEEKGELITSIVRSLYEDVDPYLEKVAIAAEVSCKKGCAYCCELLTLITLPEAFLIGEAVMKREDWKSLVVKIAKSAKDSDFPGLNRTTFAKKRLKCVFLSEDNLCSIYKERPICCRTHLVRTDPAICELSEENMDKTTEALNLLDMESVFWQLATDFTKESGYVSKYPFLTAPIPVMVMSALFEATKVNPEVHAFIKEQCRGIPNPNAWLVKHEFSLAMDGVRDLGKNPGLEEQIISISKKTRA